MQSSLAHFEVKRSDRKTAVPALRPTPVTDETAPDVLCVAHRIVNTYLVSDAVTDSWVLIDAGLPTSARRIIKTAAKRFGPKSKPVAIVLTHGHFDHVGSLKRLLDLWEVPVYAHELELPYLTGRSDYPPPDPTVRGGMMSALSRFFPKKGIDVGNKVRALPADGTVPGLPQWRWAHTPGHSPGHISLLRDSDHTLIAGDAFVTVNQESALAVLTQVQGVHGPPAYFTIDWQAARKSVEFLSAWEPQVAATGHGVPMSGLQLIDQLGALAADFDEVAVPTRGRYVREPALANEQGVISIPPPVPDPWPKVAGIGLGLVAIAATIGFVHRRRKQRR